MLICCNYHILATSNAYVLVLCSVPYSTNPLSISICIYVTVPLDVHIALPICISSSSICIFISLIHMYVNSYTQLPPSPRTFMSTSKSTSISPLSCTWIHPFHSCVFIFQFLYVHIGLFLAIRISLCQYHYCSLFQCLFFNIYPYLHSLSGPYTHINTRLHGSIYLCFVCPLSYLFLPVSMYHAAKLRVSFFLSFCLLSANHRQTGWGLHQGGRSDDACVATSFGCAMG